MTTCGKNIAPPEKTEIIFNAFHGIGGGQGFSGRIPPPPPPLIICAPLYLGIIAKPKQKL